ncbi:aldo/keto reductase [Luethyella okanaganae]|uniref:Aldo/keto reductase n=1 Tax=Luethyella okanaganae TaxID=69372 RepID=A0ABW1VKI1_9MICO
MTIPEAASDHDLSPARRHLADTALWVFPLALGGSVFGWTLDAERTTSILDRHRELGGNFVDTADSYAAGRSELFIGDWMRERRCRDEIVLATKIGRHPDNPGLSPESIVGAVDASLGRLQTDRIDLLYFHEDDPSVPLEESLGAVDALIRAGKVRYLAASDFTAERLIEARVLAANGLPRFRALQTHYNLMHRVAFEASLALVARAQALAVMPYFALANGFLAGGYRSRSALKNTTGGARATAYLNRRGNKVLTLLDRVAGEHDVPIATIAVAWLQAKHGVTAPVTGVSVATQLDAIMDAARVRLSRADMLDLDRATA